MCGDHRAWHEPVQVDNNHGPRGDIEAANEVVVHGEQEGWSITATLSQDMAAHWLHHSNMTRCRARPTEEAAFRFRWMSWTDKSRSKQDFGRHVRSLSGNGSYTSRGTIESQKVFERLSGEDIVCLNVEIPQTPVCGITNSLF